MEHDYIALDLETTGLSPKRDKIIEIGAVKVSGGRISASFSTLVKPGCKLSTETAALTGITPLMLLEAAEPEAAVAEFLAFAEDLPLLGHRILFDFSFIKRYAINQGRSFERAGVDTLKIARRYLPGLSSKALDALCRHYGILQTKQHRALPDAMAAHYLYQQLLKEFAQEGCEADFKAEKLLYQVKKEGPASERQKEYLRKLVRYYHLEPGYDIDSLTRNEASRFTDLILGSHGRPPE